MTVFASQCATLGLGDAAAVRVGQTKASIQQALSCNGVVLVSSRLRAWLLYNILEGR